MSESRTMRAVAPQRPCGHNDQVEPDTWQLNATLFSCWISRFRLPQCLAVKLAPRVVRPLETQDVVKSVNILCENSKAFCAPRIQSAEQLPNCFRWLDGYNQDTAHAAAPPTCVNQGTPFRWILTFKRAHRTEAMVLETRDVSGYAISPGFRHTMTESKVVC